MRGAGNIYGITNIILGGHLQVAVDLHDTRLRIMRMRERLNALTVHAIEG